MRICVCITFFLFLSCSNNPETYVEHVNGYWEIEKVIRPDGTEIGYKINQNIDYITINDSLKGYRKKLKPGFNNTYFTSEDSENIVLKIENDSLNIYYSTPFSNWKETVLDASQENLRILNKNNIVYLYKRYIPITFDVE